MHKNEVDVGWLGDCLGRRSSEKEGCDMDARMRKAKVVSWFGPLFGSVLVSQKQSSWLLFGWDRGWLGCVGWLEVFLL